MVGDLLEWLAACCLVAAGYFYSETRIALACVAGALSLFYLAQCYGGMPIPRRHKAD